MRVCGVDISGGDARLAMLEGSAASYSIIDCSTKKLPLQNSHSSDDIKSFKSSLLSGKYL